MDSQQRQMKTRSETVTTQGSAEMIYGPGQGIRVLKGDIWPLAGENPTTPSNEVTPILRNLNAFPFRCGWAAFKQQASWVACRIFRE